MNEVAGEPHKRGKEPHTEERRAAYKAFYKFVQGPQKTLCELHEAHKPRVGLACTVMQNLKHILTGLNTLNEPFICKD